MDEYAIAVQCETLQAFVDKCVGPTVVRAPQWEFVDAGLAEVPVLSDEAAVVDFYCMSSASETTKVAKKTTDRTSPKPSEKADEVEEKELEGPPAAALVVLKKRRLLRATRTL
ncbi:hypothetical protein [Klebsiella pneumoniae]|uniref:hypothetical protein n=1 Tax=Klebsiella pneumoniae TaxID=573 RepID=UPI0004B18C53|nr:hypothetical protein [Klebsiella pneumoniae]